MVLYQLGATINSMVKAGIAEKEIYEGRVPSLLKEARAYLVEAQSIFHLEPKTSLERRWIYSISSTYDETEALENKYREMLDV